MINSITGPSHIYRNGSIVVRETTDYSTGVTLYQGYWCPMRKDGWISSGVTDDAVELTRQRLTKPTVPYLEKMAAKLGHRPIKYTVPNPFF